MGDCSKLMLGSPQCFRSREMPQIWGAEENCIYLASDTAAYVSVNMILCVSLVVGAQKEAFFPLLKRKLLMKAQYAHPLW